jgi:hypothetical protein
MNVTFAMRAGYVRHSSPRTCRLGAAHGYDHEVAGTVLSTAMLVPLAIPGYMLGSWRWLRRTRSLREVSLVLLAFFFAWYAVLRLDGGSQVLVPVAMLALAAGFGFGHYVYWTQGRRDQPSSRPRIETNDTISPG